MVGSDSPVFSLSGQKELTPPVTEPTIKHSL